MKCCHDCLDRKGEVILRCGHRLWQECFDGRELWVVYSLSDDVGALIGGWSMGRLVREDGGSWEW